MKIQLDRFAFDGPYPMYAEEQQRFSLVVKCPWDKCNAPVGQECKKGLIFPQYPHTPRLYSAAAYHLADWAVIDGPYGFLAYRLQGKDYGLWRCTNTDYRWSAVMDDFGFLVPVSGYTNLRGY